MSGGVLLCGWVTCLAAGAPEAGLPGVPGVPGGGLTAHDVALAVLGVAMVLAVVRLFRGPSLADRVIALDLLAFFAAGVVALAAVVSERSELVIVAVVVALLTFMGTAAFALYLERKGTEDGG